MQMNARIASLAPWALSLLRFVAGLMYSMHGAQKMIGMFGGVDGHGATPPLGSLEGIGGVIELVCGLLILAGFFTRPAAFIASGEMAVAYFKFHFPGAFWPIQNGGDLPVLYCFVFLYLAAAGAGPGSIDALLFKRGKIEAAAAP